MTPYIETYSCTGIKELVQRMGGDWVLVEVKLMYEAIERTDFLKITGHCDLCGGPAEVGYCPVAVDPLAPEQVRAIRKRLREPWMAVENSAGEYTHYYNFCPYTPPRWEDPRGKGWPADPRKISCPWCRGNLEWW